MKIKLLLLTITAILIAMNVFASPGTESDPLVSRSYVDELIGDIYENILNLNEFKAKVEKEVEALRLDMEIIKLESDFNSNKTNNVSQNNSFAPVHLMKNEMLIGEEGTEIILRSGEAVAYTENENGLSNITDGTEIFNNMNISLNNLLVISRSDNRGLVVNSEEAWVLVKGGYRIIK